jgi:hypothetical protein
MTTKNMGGMPMALHEHVFNHSVILSLVFCLFSIDAFTLNGDLGGAIQDGSPNFPWLIQDLLDFHEFAGNSTYWDDHTRLECDPNWTNDLFEDDDENGYTNDIYGYDFSEKP